MKKIFACLLITTLLFGICGCKEEKNNTSIPSISLPAELLDNNSTKTESQEEDKKETNTTIDKKPTKSESGKSETTKSQKNESSQKPATNKRPTNFIVGKVNQPLTGFVGCSDDNKIFIKTDCVGYQTQELTPPEAGFTYRNGEVLELKAFDFDLKLKGDILSLYENLTIPVRYFVCDNTVYAYAMEFPGSSIKFVPIPNDNEHVLLTGAVVKKEVLVNVVDGTYELLTTKFPDYNAWPHTISDNGKYMYMFAGSSNDVMYDQDNSMYVYNFKTKKSIKVPLPKYDKQKYYSTVIIPWAIIGDKLYLAANLEGDYPTEPITQWYQFDISKSVIGETKMNLSRYSGDSVEERPNQHVMFSRNSLDNTFNFVNLKNSTQYTVDIVDSLSDSINVLASFNESGKYAKLIYDNLTTDELLKQEIINIKSGKKKDLSTLIPEYSDNKYKGCKISNLQWCGENAFLICYIKNPNEEEQKQFCCEIVEFSNF